MKPSTPKRWLLMAGGIAAAVLIGVFVVRMALSLGYKTSPGLSVGSVSERASPQRRAAPDKPTGATFVTPQRSSRVVEILAELDAGKDAPTGLEFRIGMEGRLVSAPTRRVAWLEELGRADPQAAAAYAERILNDFDSADEWAICLRNYALADSTPGGRLFLEVKLRAMLTHEPWQKNPSAGFLEAFDVAVYLGGSKLAPVLTDLVRLKDNPAVSRAAYLALDRLVITEPLPMLEHLLNHPEAMEGREATRANYFARADLSDPRQKELIEKYLLATAQPTAELQAFAGLFPNFNFMVSGNLLTRCTTPDGATIARRDREALRTVEAWLAEPRFASVRLHLKTIHNRLNQILNRSESSP